jgi:hypothetical protein
MGWTYSLDDGDKKRIQNFGEENCWKSVIKVTFLLHVSGSVRK